MDSDITILGDEEESLIIESRKSLEQIIEQTVSNLNQQDSHSNSKLPSNSCCQSEDRNQLPISSSSSSSSSTSNNSAEDEKIAYIYNFPTDCIPLEQKFTIEQKLAAIRRFFAEILRIPASTVHKVVDTLESIQILPPVAKEKDSDDTGFPIVKVGFHSRKDKSVVTSFGDFFLSLKNENRELKIKWIDGLSAFRQQKVIDQMVAEIHASTAASGSENVIFLYNFPTDRFALDKNMTFIEKKVKIISFLTEKLRVPIKIISEIKSIGILALLGSADFPIIRIDFCSMEAKLYTSSSTFKHYCRNVEIKSSDNFNLCLAINEDLGRKTSDVVSFIEQKFGRNPTLDELFETVSSTLPTQGDETSAPAKRKLITENHISDNEKEATTNTKSNNGEEPKRKIFIGANRNASDAAETAREEILDKILSPAPTTTNVCFNDFVFKCKPTLTVQSYLQQSELTEELHICSIRQFFDIAESKGQYSTSDYANFITKKFGKAALDKILQHSCSLMPTSDCCGKRNFNGFDLDSNIGDEEDDCAITNVVNATDKVIKVTLDPPSREHSPETWGVLLNEEDEKIIGDNRPTSSSDNNKTAFVYGYPLNCYKVTSETPYAIKTNKIRLFLTRFLYVPREKACRLNFRDIKVLSISDDFSVVKIEFCSVKEYQFVLAFAENLLKSSASQKSPIRWIDSLDKALDFRLMDFEHNIEYFAKQLYNICSIGQILASSSNDNAAFLTPECTLTATFRRQLQRCFYYLIFGKKSILPFLNALENVLLLNEHLEFERVVLEIYKMAVSCLDNCLLMQPQDFFPACAGEFSDDPVLAEKRFLIRIIIHNNIRDSDFPLQCVTYSKNGEQYFDKGLVRKWAGEIIGLIRHHRLSCEKDFIKRLSTLTGLEIKHY